MKVELSDEALAQVTEIDAWWRENRRGAPDLFTTELAHALELLRENVLGLPYAAGPTKIRRLLLHRTHYHVYFVEQEERVYVLAVWSAFRGRGPRL